MFTEGVCCPVVTAEMSKVTESDQGKQEEVVVGEKRAVPEGGLVEHETKKARPDPATSFFKLTRECTWKPDGVEREYTLRYIPFDTYDQPDECLACLPEVEVELLEDADEESDGIIQMVIGAIWQRGGDIVAFYGAEDGDDHIELFGCEKYSFIDDLEDITEYLTSEVDPALCDAFDDGSGNTREVLKIKEAPLCELNALLTLTESK